MPKKPIEEIDHFRTYSKSRMEYQNLSTATRFFSYFVPNSITRAGRLRSSIGLLDNYLRVEGVEKKEKEDAFAKYVKDEEERRRIASRIPENKAYSDDMYDKIHRFTESSNFDYQTAQNRYDTVKECYDEIPWTQKLYSRLLPDSWTHAGRIRKSLNMSRRMLDRQINGDALFKPVPGQNLSKNETIMHNYLETYKGYAKEYSKLSGFQKFLGRVLPSSWTDYGKLKIDMEINDMMLLRETNIFSADDLQEIRDTEYDKVVNPDKYKTTKEAEDKDKQFVQNEIDQHKQLYDNTNDLEAKSKDLQKEADAMKKENINENEKVDDKENSKEKDPNEKSNLDLNEIKKDSDNKELNNDNLINNGEIKENQELNKSQNDLNNNEILEDDKKDPIKKDENNKSDFDLNKDNEGLQKNEPGVIKNIKNEDESIHYNDNVNILFQKDDLDPNDENFREKLDKKIDEENKKFGELGGNNNKQNSKVVDINHVEDYQIDNFNKQYKSGVNNELTQSLQQKLGHDTGADQLNSSRENFENSANEMGLYNNNTHENESFNLNN